MATQKRRMPGPVIERLETLAIEHPEWTPPQLRDVLLSKFADADVPSLRTVQRWHRDYRRPDVSGEWNVASADGQEIALVLPVIRHMIERRHSRGSVWHPSRGVADWIVRLRTAYPDLEDPETVWLLATFANRGGEEVQRVETFLAFTPWRDKRAALDAALANGDVWDVADFRNLHGPNMNKESER